MFRSPSPPHTLTVRHLECISCKYILEVSHETSRRYRVNHWIPWPERIARITGIRLTRMVRFFSNWKGQPNLSVRGDTSQQTNNDVDEINPVQLQQRSPQHHDSPTELYCPRCGTNNSNWLYLSHTPVKQWSSRLQKYLIFSLGIILTVALMSFLGIQGYNEKKLSRSIIYLVILGLAGLLTFFIITSQWRALRDYKYLSRISEITSSKFISPPIMTSLILIGIFVFLIPVLYFFLTPITRNWAKTTLNSKPQPSQIQQIDTLMAEIPGFYNGNPDKHLTLTNIVGHLQKTLYEQRSVCSSIELEQMTTNLKMVLSGDAKIGNAALLASAINELEMIQEFDTTECHPNLLTGVALLLQTYQLSNNQVTNTTTNANCLDQITAKEAISGQQFVNLDPACHQQLINHIISRIELQERDFSQIEISTAAPEEIKVWMLSVLNGIRNLVIDSPDGNLQTQIATDLTSLENLVMPSPPDEFAEKLSENTDFVFDWVRYVGVTMIAASIVAVWFCYQTEEEYDSHLPRPVFYTVSHMTQTAKWEINRTLEPRGLAEHIQWVKVERNREGGINLTGLFRDPPDLENGGPTEKVRAQEYVIVTDPWCHIRSTTIKDKSVRRPAGGPAFVVPENARPENARRSTPIRVRW